MKAYTDISQSKKLAEILPLESADMYYNFDVDFTTGEFYFPADGLSIMVRRNNKPLNLNLVIPCWSLAALLGVVPYLSLHKTFSGWRCDSYDKEGKTCKLGESTDNPIDSCYEMILKLHELNLL